MEMTQERREMVELLVEQALKVKIPRMARKYDPPLFFKLWAQIVKIGGVKAYFSKWRWKEDLTILEALDALDDYCVGLESLLRERQEKMSKRKCEARS